MEYVVLATNTNHNDVVFGPFSDEDEAKAFGFERGSQDQLHEHRVLRLYSPDEASTYVEPEAPRYDHDRGKELLQQAVQEERDAGEAPDQVDNEAAADQVPTEVVGYDSGIPIKAPITEDEDDEEEEESDEAAPTLTELQGQAAALNIPGRSSMNKAELAAAIAEAEEEEDE